MRKFFKSLAVLLALTLIVGVVPAAAADSLTMAKEKTLYLGGSQGAKEDGTNCKITAKKKVANMIKGFDADTMTVVLSSADKSIVKTTKAGRIVAKSIGTTTVTVTVLDAADTQIFKQDLKVKVKKNATDVTVTGIADGDSFKVGQTVEVTLPRAGVDTDERELTVDKADNVEITKGEKARVYNVKFVKAGDVTFTAKAFQSTKYPAPTQKKDIKVTVANPAPTGIKVVASNAYELTFDTDVEAAGLFKDPKEIANDACYYMLNDTKVTFSAVKAVKATGNVVKVTTYDNFAAGTTYYVVVNGSDPLSFVIAGTAAKDVESIAILTDTVEVNKAVEIKVALYNADGVDITSAVGTDSVSFTSTNLNSYVDGKTLNMYNVGDTTDLTATFTYYDPNNNYEAKTKTATKKITAVPQTADVIEKVIFSVDNTSEVITANYANPKNYVAIGDESKGYRVKIFLVAKNGNNDVSIEVNGGAGVVGTGRKLNNKVIYAKVPEESIAILGSHDGIGYPITPNSVGRTNVFIGYDDTPGNPATFKTLQVCAIEVRAARYPASLKVAPSKSNLNTTASTTDTIEIGADVADQYGDSIAPAANGGINLQFEVIQNDQSKAVATVSTGALNYTYAGWGGHYKFVLDKNAITYNKDDHTANIVFTTKIKNWDSKAPVVGCNFTAKDVGTRQNDDQVSFVNSGASTLDTTITGTSVYKKAELQATTLRSGFFTDNINLVWRDDAPTQNNVATDGALTYAVTVKKGSKFITSANITDDNLNNFLNMSSVATGKIILKNFYFNAGVVSKLPKDQYVFTVYKIAAGTTAKSDTVISSMTTVVNVTDNQASPVFTQLSETASSAELNANPPMLHNCFKFTFAGHTYQTSGVVSYGNDLYNSPCVTSSSNATNAKFVRKAVVNVTVDIKDEVYDGTAPRTASFRLMTDINKLIKIK